MKIRIELEVEVSPYTREQLLDSGFEGEDAEPDTDVDAPSIARCVANMFGDDSEAVQEVFAGSELFVNIGEATVIRAETVGDPS
jgi:hypothetical protein